MEEQTTPGTHGLVLHWAARYDLLAWLLTRGRERDLRQAIIRLAELQQANDVLDIGCGTGTLAIAASSHVGKTGGVTGIDASPSMIARANQKAVKAGAPVTFHVAIAESLSVSSCHRAPRHRHRLPSVRIPLHHPRNTNSTVFLEFFERCRVVSTQTLKYRV